VNKDLSFLAPAIHDWTKPLKSLYFLTKKRMLNDNIQSTGVEVQPTEDTSVNTQEIDQEDSHEEPTVEIDGEKVPISIVKAWKEGNMRQEDYTRKTQELAEAKRELARVNPTNAEYAKPDDLSDEAKAAIDVLKKAGFATKEDIQMLKVQEEDAKNFRRLIKSYPELKTHEKALKQIGLTDNRAWEDIAKDYGFLSADKVAKAKAQNPVKGAKSLPGAQEKKLDIASMNEKEYEAWKRANLGQGKWA
jgi:hypothetical protein